MRQSRAILVEYVQEMRADLFNLTSISKKNKLYKQFLQYDQNLCEIVVWHIFVIFVILNSDSNETYRFTMRENNIGKYERSIFKWQVYL